ncbi:MAG: ATP-binding protein [Parachlamydiaceae bacterium]|nr:ATP-binding protein [Parachlamydiaceae bacterium]
MKDYEKLGVFYLGKIFGQKKQDVTDPLLLDSKDLTTHAVCVGMTGSGKTGLGIALLEEAAIDKIPAIIIDPKGDLGNLLLTFPSLSANDFRPWVDASEAERNGETLDAYAETISKKWKEGLAKWDEPQERIQKLRDSVDIVIYTPASNAGIPLSVLSSFAAPSKETIQDTTALRDRVLSVTSSLLGLIGIVADPIKSREHILISTLFNQAWSKGKDIDLRNLIQQVQKPAFDKIGALDLDTFFPTKERMKLAISLNNLLASPGFQAWMEGDPLDIDQLLYNKDGKPKLSIISIAHLSDSERMFFVTLLLNEMLSWMRKQPGTSSLRALFYMDEIFGYFPPTAMPPSKGPMMSLLKQARAFGLGIVLVTQNPVDLDYKGLSNCGIWFIGKLQTERDKARVLEGLNAASNGELDTKSLNKLIALTGNRIFLMRSIYLKEPVLFETRWTLSYLRGPLTLTQISKLSEKFESPKQDTAQELQDTPQKQPKSASDKAIVPAKIQEYFISRANVTNPTYKPLVAGIAKLHFVDATTKTDIWDDVCIVAGLNTDGQSINWDAGENVPEIKSHFETTPLPNSSFKDLPSFLMQEKNYAASGKLLSTWLYQNQSRSLFKYQDLGLTSKTAESEEDFRTRVSLALRENRDQAVNKLREKYGQKINTLKEKLQRSQSKVAQKQSESTWQKAEAFITAGSTILGAILGKGVTKGTISQAGTSMRRIGKIGKDNQDAEQAEEDSTSVQEQLNAVQNQLNQEIDLVPKSIDPSSIKLEEVKIKPRKSDISVENIFLIWWPI